MGRTDEDEEDTVDSERLESFKKFYEDQDFEGVQEETTLFTDQQYRVTLQYTTYFHLINGYSCS
jgi:hypothetical protein